MPRGDGTGPMGTGPMTGMSKGYCAGNGMAGFTNRIPGKGMGRGRGGSRGSGRGMGRPLGWDQAAFAANASASATAKQDEVEILKNQANDLGEALREISTRISELESRSER